MKTQHTPTPWIVDERVGVTILAQKHINAIGLSWKPEVASCHLGIGLEWNEQEANAEFICRAVNAHDDLVAALEDLIAARSDLSYSADKIASAYDFAAKALAKAKGEV